MVGRRNLSIQIVEYQARWASEFTELAAALAQRLGAQALAVDHIGSTAVRDLAAKDVIDIQVTVADLADPRQSAALVTTIVSTGYEHRPGLRDNLVGLNDTSPELRKLYFCERAGGRKVHIHVREVGRVNQQYALLFRDYLRADAFVRDAYQRVKKELAVRFANDAAAYYAIKDPYMDTVYRAALLWNASGRL